MTIKNIRKEELKLEAKATLNLFKEQYPGVIETPIKDSVNKIESLGIFVLISAAPEKVSGFCMIIGENTFIFINKSQVFGRQNFSLWHEVYHWFTSTTGAVSIVNDQKNNEIEYLADYFASLVLIDKAYLSEKLNNMGFIDSKTARFIKYDDIIKLQHHFGVSYSAMVRKIIEIYSESGLDQRYALGSIPRQGELIQKTEILGLDVNLILPSTETYISEELFVLLKDLSSENKISENKIFSIMDIIEKELD